MLHKLETEETVPGSHQRAYGAGRIAAKTREGVSALDTLYQEGCAKIRAPKNHGDWLDAVLINSSGGLTGGDRIDWTCSAGEGAHLVATTQACERIYRSIGGAAKVRTTLSAGPRARLDWLPQETILFEGARLDRTLAVDLAADATFLGLEAVILGREASGEDAVSAAISDTWHVRRGGHLIHAEASRLNANDALARANIALLNGARAYATLCYVADDAERHIEALKAILSPFETAGASRIGEKIVMRAAAPSGYRLRKIVMPAIAALAAGNAVPRLWTL
ncbi:urease accessory protein UreD [Pelagibacterium xiamenense]|uniref:urease accessory protein UreD n=1 Tax=Pelagibacterium xiamenense TaxID=2901140 RepID=UPI001E497420|nr:urease accessory protein UreD [Pelagibacterium xiamenense]MCD7058700.1 urease accessory protein UreD [Pelagibacterium xiamenense]